jgi:predicted lipoprotein with Yx(FWY)xxD motif
VKPLPASRARPAPPGPDGDEARNWAARVTGSGRHWRLELRLAGAGLLAATGAIHLDLYWTGYRSIATIGPLFLLQVSAVFAVAGATLVFASRLLAAAGAGLALATLCAYLVAVWNGLLGFTEIRTTAGIAAGLIEVAAFAALATLAVFPAARDQAARQTAADNPGLARLHAMTSTGVPGAGWAVTGICILALAAFGIAVARAAGPGSASASGGLKTATIGGVRVLTSERGFTLYWFAPDTATRSACYGSCAAYWPPVTGTPSLGPGVPGKLATIERSGGTMQITYNGHPLYTYVADTAPGQAFGNNLNLNGGLWHEVTVGG